MHAEPLGLRGAQVGNLCFKETRGYWELKEDALDRNLWRILLGRGYGPVVRQTKNLMNINVVIIIIIIIINNVLSEQPCGH